MADNDVKQLEQCEFEVLVPQATDLDIDDQDVGRETTPGEERHADAETQRPSELSSIPLRTSLHFDEQLNVFVVLRTPSGISDWEKHLPYLQINLEVQAFGSNTRGSDGQSSEDQSVQPQGKDVIWSGTVSTGQQPTRIREKGRIALLWTVKCFLNRPRVRMQHPMISFKASGILRGAQPFSEDSTDPFLPSGVPASINVLAPLSGDPGLRGIRPQLTALRLDRININSSSTVREIAIRSKPQKPFPALPALSARVRYSKSGTYTGRRCIIASLDIETAPFQNDEIQLKNVEMQLSNGVAEDLCKGHAINLPMVCQPRDNLVFLFRLLPDGDQTENPKASSNSKALDISIDAYVFISGTCRPYIRMRWRSLVDFSTALNPKFGGPTQAMQRNRRPSTLAVPSDTEKRASDGVNLGESNEDPPATQRTSFHDHFGLTLTLTAPKDVYIGRPFTWDVFLVNRSPRPRNLVILVIPKRVPSDHKNHITRTSMSSTATVQAAKGGKVDHAEAVLDENRLYALQKGLAREDVGVVSLSTEVRVGTLSPGFCHNTELKFLALEKGVLHIEAVRVVDLMENKSVDVRDLPEIVAEERVADE